MRYDIYIYIYIYIYIVRLSKVKHLFNALGSSVRIGTPCVSCWHKELLTCIAVVLACLRSL